MDVPCSHHCDVFRYLQPRLCDGAHGADSHRVVVAEDPIRRRIGSQQLLHGLVATLIAEAGIYNESRWRPKSVGAQGASIPGKSRRRNAVLRPTEVCDTPAPLGNEVLRSQSAESFIVHSYEAGAHAGHRAV